MADPQAQPTDKQSAQADIATKWHQEIERYNKWSQSWVRKAEKLLKLYARQKSDTTAKRKFAMLWANTEVLKPSLYARCPIPQVSRRYRDKDAVGRTAAELLERAAIYWLDDDRIHEKFKHCRDDVLLPGRGTAWLRVEANEADDGSTTQKLVCDYVHWKDFMHSPCRVWEECTWVGKWSYLTKDQVAQRFGKDIAKKLPLDQKASTDGTITNEEEQNKGPSPRAQIAEIWDKTTRKVYFISKAYPEPLEVSDPFLDLHGFWPCPRPLYATLTTEALIPTPDYVYYRDQAEEIDQLTARIGSLTDALKMVGFYPAGSSNDVQQAIERAMKPETENVMIPVESWAAFAESGGVKAIVFLPIQDVVTTIQACIQLRQQLIQDVYQISGISDVLRGATDPNETATAQSLKAQWGSVRIRDRQEAIQEFCRDVIRIGCEIMAEKFDFDTLRQMANMMPQPDQSAQDALGAVLGAAQQPAQGMPPAQAAAMPLAASAMPDMGGGMDMSGMNMGGTATPPASMAGAADGAVPPAQPPQSSGLTPEWDESIMPGVAELLQNDKLRSFRIDIETDSTIQADEDAEKQRRTEFITAVGQFIQQALPAAQMQPALVPMLGEMLLFMVRGFRAGRTMEDAIERTMSQLMQQQGQQQPDPNMLKAQMQMQMAQLELQIKQAEAQIKLQQMQGAADIRNQELGQDLQASQADYAMKAQDRADRTKHAAIQALNRRVALGAPPQMGQPPGAF